MNKLLTKIVGLTLGLSMAIGVGVAASYSEKDAVRADAAAVGGTDTIDSSVIDLSSKSTSTWTAASLSAMTSGAVYSYRLMGTKDTTDGRIGGTNANGGFWTTSSGGVLNSVTVTTTTSKTLALYGGNTAFTAYNDTTDRTDLGSHSTSGSGSTYTYTWSNLASNNCTYALLKGTQSSTFIKSVVFVWNAPSSDPSIALSTNELGLATTTKKTLDVTYENLTANISVTQSGTGSVDLSIDDETYNSSLSLDYTKTSPQTIYIKGKTAGSVTLSFASTNATTRTCAITVSEPSIYEKITSTSLMKDGGSYLLIATGTELAMNKTQLSNGRGPATVDFVDDKAHLPSITDVAVLTIEAGTGDYTGYYTIFDPAYSTNGGYLEIYNNNLTTYYQSSTPSTDAYYWSISFSDNHVVLENKSYSGYYLEYNAASNAKYFRMYQGTQTKIDLYELTSDIPSVTYLSSITAANVTVGEGSTITYSGSYEPSNATVSIAATLGSDIATLGEITMSNGTFTVSITGTTSGSTTLTLSGPSSATTTTSVTPTLTVSSYTATHTLVTASSSLDNGSKVVFGSQYNPETESEKYAISGAAHTGGDYVPVVSTAYNSTKTTLAAAVSTKEYTMWCIDSTNGYWVLSDGGYFLCAPESAGNKLQRTNQLSDRCYFLIEDNTAGIVVKSYYAQEQHWQYQSEDVDYTIQYNYNNGTNSRFSLYRAESQTVASLYLSNQSLDRVQGFVDAFMHFGNVPHNPLDSDTGNCKDTGYGYFTAALNAYNQLTSSEQEAFCTESEYANAYDRFSDWASANGYSFNGYTLEQDARLGLSIFGADNQTSITVIVIIAAISITSIGALLVLKKRKEQF